MARKDKNKDSKKRAKPDVIPEDGPSVLPPGYDQHSFILQAVMESQKAIGVLTAKVDRLIEDVGQQSDDIHDLKAQATFLKGWLAGAVVIIGVIVAVGAFIIDQGWDSIAQQISQITVHPSVTVETITKE